MYSELKIKLRNNCYLCMMCDVQCPPYVGPSELDYVYIDYVAMSSSAVQQKYVLQENAR